MENLWWLLLYLRCTFSVNSVIFVIENKQLKLFLKPLGQYRLVSSFCRNSEHIHTYITPIHSTGVILYPLKTSENLWSLYISMETTDCVTFTWEILYEKLHFLCSVSFLSPNFKCIFLSDLERAKNATGKINEINFKMLLGKP